MVALEKWGNSARFITTGKAYEPDEIDMEAFDLANDPHKLILDEFREAIKSRNKVIAKIEEDEPSVYAFIYRHLSNESLDAIKLLEDYGKFHDAKDPVLLCLGIAETHKVASTSTVPSVLKADSRAKYQAIHQGSFESIVGYKERFDTALAGYKDMENPKMAPEDIAMDFMRGLDNARYSEFKANPLNDLLVPGTKAPETLNAMYTRAAAYILPRNVTRNGKGAVFATRADDLRDTGRGRGDRGSGGRGRGGRGSAGRGSAGRGTGTKGSKSDKPKAKKPLICWGCGEEGHRLGECPQNNGADDSDGEEREGFGAVTLRNAFVSGGPALQWYEVLLDNEADVSILDRRLLNNVRESRESFSVSGIVSGQSATLPLIGDLTNFLSVTPVMVALRQMFFAKLMSRTCTPQGRSYTVMGT
jgi:hypothetical protein